jgi:hypothetical protein
MHQSASILRGLLRCPPAWGLLAVIFGGVFALCCTEAAWDGYTSVLLEFVVVDAETNEPVSGSLVQLKDGSPEYHAPFTGKDGRTKFIIEAACGGRSSIFRQTRSVNYGAWEASVEANGYKTFKDAFFNLTRDQRYHDKNAIPPPIVIKFRR